LLKISIITINLNNKAGLDKTIASVIAQSYTPIEFIVIDGESKDGSVDVIRDNADHISYWISEKDKGVYSAMNKGIRAASGDYLLFLNSGDVLSNEKVLAHLIEDETGETDLIYGDLERYFPDGKKDIVNMPAVLTVEHMLNKTLCHPVTLIKRSLFEKFGLYDESLKIVADWAFFFKLILFENVSYKHKDLAVAIFGMDGMSASISNQLTIGKEREFVINKYFNPVMRSFVREKIFYEDYYRKYRIEKIHHVLKKIYGLSLNGRKILRWPVSKMKYFINSAQTKLELGAYKKRNREFCFNIPIIINNRNRLTYLKRLISSLEKLNYKNIFIIDNASSFPDLLAYYKQTPYTVFRLDKNVGYCALWDTDIFKKFSEDYYVYTDSDMELHENCPADFMTVLKYLLEKYQHIGKVGLSITTEDLPDHFHLKHEVLKVESQYAQNRVEKMGVAATVDTTFALYRPGSFGNSFMLSALRTTYPYSIRHLPWYEHTSDLDEEQRFYYDHANESSYWGNRIKERLSN
jgi:glycosyltransferase involved in cell wall biosynthesis